VLEVARLRASLSKQSLEPSPGTSIFAGDGSITVVDFAQDVQIDAEVGADAEVQELLAHLTGVGALRPASWADVFPARVSIQPSDLLRGTADVVVTAIEALSVTDPSSQTTGLIVELFLATLPDELAICYERTMVGGWELVALSPTNALRAVLTFDPPSGVATANSHSWVRQLLDAPTGRLRPAQSADAREVRGWWTASSKVARRFQTLGQSSMWGAGVATSAEGAKIAAVAEAHERFSASYLPLGELRTAKEIDLVGAVDPRKFIDYTEEQRERNRDLIAYRPDRQRLWVEAHSLAGEVQWILADLVFYPFGTADHRRHTSANSSGMAAGRDYASAVTSAWFELVERDAFMRSWLGRLAGDRLNIPRAGTGAELVKDLESMKWTIELRVLWGSQGDWSILAMAEHGSKLSLGSAAGPDATTAITKAISEAWAGVVLVSSDEKVPEIADVRSPSDHRRLYRWGDVGPAARAHWMGGRTLEGADLPPQSIASRDLIVIEWPPWLTAPLRVVRVLCPEMIPITFGGGLEPLGRPDVAELLVAAGGPPPLPHPFP